MALPPTAMMSTWFSSSSTPHPERAERRSSQPQELVEPSVLTFAPSRTANGFPATIDLPDLHPVQTSTRPAPYPYSLTRPVTQLSHADHININPPPPLANPTFSSLSYPALSSTTTMPALSLNRPVPIPPVFSASAQLYAPEDAHGALEDAQSPSSAASGGRPREKRHACWLCHKAFDRPSTLRKHLLVHTGEKAYACDKCGRRFGVLSNLNRHLRKCSPDVTKPADTNEDTTAESSPASVPASIASPESADSPTTVSIEIVPQARGRARSSATVDAAGSGGASSPRKRRTRRAPSPERWVPESLRAFNLTVTDNSCSVPLPPVLSSQSGAGIVEERNSYEEFPIDRPYHPEGWHGRLPGPGLRDIISNGMSSMGRLVFF